jgi:4-amino-4-deoxy-L-arabinose transferase-like glycosyltransferase
MGWARVERNLHWVILAAVLLVSLLTLRDYGVTINEPFEGYVGDAVSHFFATWRLADLPDTKLGVFFQFVASRVAHLTMALGAQDPYLGRHLCNVLAGAVGLLGTYSLGRSLASHRVGVLALAILALAPRYYGSSFNNPKDVPFAAAFVWAVWGVARLLRNPTVRNAALCGALGAFCTAVRPQGFFFVVLGAAACCWPIATPVEPLWKRLVALVPVALVLTIILWPVVLGSPPWLLLQSASTVSHEGGERSLFLGKVYAPDDQPGSYVVVWLAATLPLPTLLLAFAGVLFCLRVLRNLGARERGWGLLLFAIWFLLPMGLPVVHRTPMYHAIRHFLFVVPGLSLLAAAGLDRLASLAWFRTARWRLPALVGAVTISYADVAATEVRLHPYEDLYFSRLVGGVRGASTLFAVAYYGEAYGEAFRWLAMHPGPPGTPVHVTALGGPFTMETFEYYAKRSGMDLDTPTLGYLVAQVDSLNRDKVLPGEVLYTVEREGVPLAIVARVSTFDPVERAWLEPSGQALEALAGRLPLAGRPALLALPIASPSDQDVTMLMGFSGMVRIAVNPSKAVFDRTGRGMVFPSSAVVLPLRRGLNVVLLDAGETDRAAGLTLETEANRGLRFVPPPGSQ